MPIKTHPEIVSTETELKRLRAWIEEKSDLVCSHMNQEVTLNGIPASALAEQISEARKAEAQLALIKFHNI